MRHAGPPLLAVAGLAAVLACGSFGAEQPPAGDAGLASDGPGTTAGDASAPRADAGARATCSGPFTQLDRVTWPPEDPQSLRFGAAGRVYLGVHDDATDSDDLQVWKFGPDADAPPTQELGRAAALNSTDDEHHAAPLQDGLFLVYERSPADGGPDQIWLARRDSLDAPFLPGAPLAIPVGVGARYEEPFVVGGRIYFSAGDDEDIWSGRLDLDAGAIVSPAPFVELAHRDDDGYAVLPSTELAIYFASERERDAGTDAQRIWVARRATPEAPFGTPERALGVVAEWPLDRKMRPTWISDDECTLYVLGENASGDLELHRATRTLPAP
jgi:hypothetical protein